MQLVNDVINS